MKQNWIDKYSLPLASLGLMVFSAGLDGAYLAKMMPMLGGAFGYALNLVADCSCLLLSYWYGRLRQSPKDTKRYRYALALLPAEIVGVGYSWFLSWRQLRIVLPAIEPDAWRWVAPVAAGFVPLLLAFTGYAQSLLAGRIEKEKAKEKPVVVAAVSARSKSNGNRSFAEFERSLTEGELDVSAMTGQQVGQWAGKSAATGRRWKRLAGNGGNASETTTTGLSARRPGSTPTSGRTPGATGQNGR